MAWVAARKPCALLLVLGCSFVCDSFSQLLEENLQYQDQIAGGSYAQPAASTTGYAAETQPQAYAATQQPLQQQSPNPYAYGQTGGAQPYGGVSPEYVGQVSAQYDEPIPAPLVTDESEEEASKLFPGKVLPDLSHRHIIRMAALRRQLAMYGNTPSWIFISSFIGMVGGMTGLWMLAKNQWENSQDGNTF